MRHRMAVNFEGQAENVAADALVAALLKGVAGAEGEGAWMGTDSASAGISSAG